MQITSTNRVVVEPGAGVVAHVGLHALALLPIVWDSVIYFLRGSWKSARPKTLRLGLFHAPGRAGSCAAAANSSCA
jgi:hypothetical protein